MLGRGNRMVGGGRRWLLSGRGGRGNDGGRGGTRNLGVGG